MIITTHGQVLLVYKEYELELNTTAINGTTVATQHRYHTKIMLTLDGNAKSAYSYPLQVKGGWAYNTWWAYNNNTYSMVVSFCGQKFSALHRLLSPY